jgi:hypothetical protein
LRQDESEMPRRGLADAGSRWRDADRRVWLGRAIPVVAVLAALVSLDAAGAGVQRPLLGLAWQVIDLEVLGADPVGSLWYLHTQPPLHNALLALVVAGPFPVDGTLYAMYGACLVGMALLLHDLLVRWGTGPLAAGWIAAVATVHPSLLGTIRIMSYEVPVALALVAAVWAVQRYLDDPGTGRLVTLAAILTVGAATRSLLHPLWVLGVLALVWLARSATRRQVLVSAAIPVVVLGGWVVKNQIVYDTPTLSSWDGFNMQRGIVASMSRDDVERDVRAGHVSSLALEYPWQRIDRYAEWTDGCRPVHGHEVAAAIDKRPYDGAVWINYNYECYLPVYAQARSDALALVRRHPGRYVATRAPALIMSFDLVGTDDERATWMDDLLLPLHLTAHHTIDMSDWNLPFYGDTFTLRYSLLLLALTLALAGRGGVAAVRLVRQRRDRQSWSTAEVVWLVAAFSMLWVVVGGDLVEFGENSRFRASVDPLLLALPLAAMARLVSERWGRRVPWAAAGSGDP